MTPSFRFLKALAFLRSVSGGCEYAVEACCAGAVGARVTGAAETCCAGAVDMREAGVALVVAEVKVGMEETAGAVFGVAEVKVGMEETAGAAFGVAEPKAGMEETAEDLSLPSTLLVRSKKLCDGVA